MHAFKNNNMKDLTNICKKFDVGVVKIEIARNELPNINF